MFTSSIILLYCSIFSGQSISVYCTDFFFDKGPDDAARKKGIRGHVCKTGQSFKSVKIDYSNSNLSGSGPGLAHGGGKGYHVNVQVGKDAFVFVSTRESSDAAYQDCIQMLGERYQWDGPNYAAKWYVNMKNPD